MIMNTKECNHVRGKLNLPTLKTENKDIRAVEEYGLMREQILEMMDDTDFLRKYDLSLGDVSIRVAVKSYYALLLLNTLEYHSFLTLVFDDLNAIDKSLMKLDLYAPNRCRRDLATNIGKDIAFEMLTGIYNNCYALYELNDRASLISEALQFYDEKKEK